MDIIRDLFQVFSYYFWYLHDKILIKHKTCGYISNLNAYFGKCPSGRPFWHLSNKGVHKNSIFNFIPKTLVYTVSIVLTLQFWLKKWPWISITGTYLGKCPSGRPFWNLSNKGVHKNPYSILYRNLWLIRLVWSFLYISW